MLHSLTHRHGHDNQHPASHSAEGANATSKITKRRSSGLRFFASSAVQDAGPPTTTTPPHKRWERDYIKDLRTNRPARPSGSRPLPGRAATSLADPFARASSAMSVRPSLSTQQAAFSGETADRAVSALSHRRARSDMPASGQDDPSRGERGSQQAKPRRDFSNSTQASKTSVVAPSATYRDSGMRWMEKQEARSLREAMEDMDARKEAKLHAAAQKEATDLVKEHLEGSGQIQKANRRRSYREHLQIGAHARSQSHAGNGLAVGPHVIESKSRTVSGNSTSTSSNDTKSGEATRPTTPETESIPEEPKSHMEWDSPQKKAYMSLTFPFELRKTSGRRRSSGNRARDFSGGLFRNPKDKIYEEPNEDVKEKEVKWADTADNKRPLSMRARNSVSKIQKAGQPFLRSRQSSAEEKEKKRLNISEIQKNPPSQSRNPSYTKNESPEQKDGVEIRSDDIRAATSMRMKDKSLNLPSPTVVSGRQDRPIVSFDNNWRPKSAEKDSEAYDNSSVTVSHPTLPQKPSLPESTVSAPAVPTINLPEPTASTPTIPTINIPMINLPESLPAQANSPDDVFAPSTPTSNWTAIPSPPSISFPSSTPPSQRPTPTAPNPRPLPSLRPLPHHSFTAPAHTSSPHWSPSPHRTTAQCSACALPISGRTVTASSQRFHPHCFTCHHCATALECVAFYPEPEAARDSRLARIEARTTNANVPLVNEKPGETALDDGDESLRFYCHLDYHETFSPRCKSCHTPIESEVVLACGSTWHVGHFFCAQCGDPFGPQTPFVEREGFAWCVGCHQGRFSEKCVGCRKPVVGEGVRVEGRGGEWHGECFRCSECKRPFDDGKFFTREAEQGKAETMICVRCEERRLKA